MLPNRIIVRFSLAEGEHLGGVMMGGERNTTEIMPNNRSRTRDKGQGQTERDTKSKRQRDQEKENRASMVGTF